MVHLGMYNMGKYDSPSMAICSSNSVCTGSWQFRAGLHMNMDKSHNVRYVLNGALLQSRSSIPYNGKLYSQ